VVFDGSAYGDYLESVNIDERDGGWEEGRTLACIFWKTFCCKRALGMATAGFRWGFRRPRDCV
jgi:hypothetical protein